MIAQSVVADHDLDLANNYTDNDGRLFGHDHLAMGPHARREATVHVGNLYHVDVMGARGARLHAVLVDEADLRPGVDCPRVRDVSGLLALLSSQPPRPATA
jgi:hypothetical protein